MGESFNSHFKPYLEELYARP